MESKEHTGETFVKVKRGKVDSLSVYEITDYELDTLVRGSPNTLFLNFSIFLLSLAVSFLISLLTAKIDSDRVFMVFVIIVVVGFLAGFVLLGLWLRTRESISELVRKIKKRIPSEEIKKEGGEPGGGANPEPAADASSSG